jgi:K+-sensing histidine kinase KdpD
MFQKFTRLSARPTAGESSTGLGLSIVKRLVEGMNGTIQCQSTLGLGTTFIVRLPICPATLIPPANAAENQARAGDAVQGLAKNQEIHAQN